MNIKYRHVMIFRLYLSIVSRRRNTVQYFIIHTTVRFYCKSNVVARAFAVSVESLFEPPFLPCHDENTRGAYPLLVGAHSITNANIKTNNKNKIQILTHNNCTKNKIIIILSIIHFIKFLKHF